MKKAVNKNKPSPIMPPPPVVGGFSIRESTPEESAGVGRGGYLELVAWLTAMAEKGKQYSIAPIAGVKIRSFASNLRYHLNREEVKFLMATSADKTRVLVTMVGEEK